jgi:hypothetical protein
MVMLAATGTASYLAVTARPHRREKSNPEMIEHLRRSTLHRVSGPRVFALMGVVRPGMWIFGGDSAGGRAP